MRITDVTATDLFLGPAAAPRQVVRVRVTGVQPPVRVRVDGPTVFTPEPAVLTVPGDHEVEVGVRFAAPAPDGSVHRVTAVADGTGTPATASASITAAATGWTMWMVSHFHYDPVWWNTQAGFTQVWHDLPDVPWVGRLRPPFVRTAFDLVQAHLDAAAQDQDYRFVLAEIDYLKPFWDAFPQRRAQLRRFLREDRVELVGGLYNEPNTNLTHPESTVRNAVYGIGYQRDVLGGDPRTAWMLDVFGHDPAFPGLMADAGLDSSAWARGPFHMVGPRRHTGDITRAQFASEFEWVSPGGQGLLTAYLANHYVAGWDMERKSTLDEAVAEAYAQYRELARVAATPNVLLPVGHDHNLPSRWCTQVQREWARRYAWPRFVVGLPRDFFAAVRAASGRAASGSARAGGVRGGVRPQTRDMNPVYTGKDVSYIDTKQAQRAAETALLDAERLATLALLFGARYPAEALDKAWRLLAYGAHHDAITGTESDQVYLDLLGGWREAYELGAAARDGAIAAIAARADTAGPGTPVLAVNTLSWPRGGVTTVRLGYPAPGPSGVDIVDGDGAPVPAVAEGERRHPDGSLAEVTLTFLAQDVPALGYRTYRAVPAPGLPGGWVPEPGATEVRNDTFLVAADPARGGALCRVRDLRAGRELLRPGGLGAELYLQDEHPNHPFWGEGPWHLLPRGPGRGMREEPAEVRVEHSAAGSRIVACGRLGGLRVRQEVTLWRGLPRVDVRTGVDGSIGQDRLLRARFQLDAPGALPVCDTGFATIGRSFGFPDSDAATHLYTLDSPAHTWAGLSATARIALRHPDGRREWHAFGVAEVVAPAGERCTRELLARLAACGVTATLTEPDGPRYGALDADSNLPDVRIALGTDRAFAAQVLESAEPGYREALARTGRVLVPAARARREVLVPGADLRGARDLPVLIVADAQLSTVVEELAGATVEVEVPAGLPGTTEPLDGYSVALVNRGTPGFVADPDGTLYLSLMRACGDWPSGVWLDGPRRTVPDGSSFALQHWTHTFEYSLVAGAGDWRSAGFVTAGHEVNHPILARPVPPSEGDLGAVASLGSVTPAGAVLTALKPRGNPIASGLPAGDGVADGVTVRLYESTGTATTARVRLHGGLAGGVRTDVVERVVRAPVTVDGGELVVPLRPAEVVTLGATVLGEDVVPLGPVAQEPAQPVFTRYWLHNKGPAPVGYLPVSVYLRAAGTTRLAAPADGLELHATVACSAAPARGRLELDVPAGLVVAPAGPRAYDLGPDGYAEFVLRLSAPDAAAGTYTVAARIRDDLGQVLEDVVTVAVGAGQVSDPLAVTLDVDGLALSPGETGVLAARLVNGARSEVRGEAQLVSPYGTWGAGPADPSAGPWSQGFAVPALGSAELSWTVRAPAAARPGAHW
ncbi:MAG TPA: glycosyl hydrolase-related protein, partial [Rugosimonospora sp.]|nr:glycosyl hydrolase-related protein [Rugosimonospora sp.]